MADLAVKTFYFVASSIVSYDTMNLPAGQPPRPRTTPTTPAPQHPAARPARKNVKLPGLMVDFQESCVDLGSPQTDRLLRSKTVWTEEHILIHLQEIEK